MEQANRKLFKWVLGILKLTIFALLAYIFFTASVRIVDSRVKDNVEECSQMTVKETVGLNRAKIMVACLRQKNGFLENLTMKSVYRAIDAMPVVSKNFVGTWEASQPRCKYRYTFREDGSFSSEAIDCALSSQSFKGQWGVFEQQFIWLPNEKNEWPPDINPMDVVDKDFFLLIERDGTRTRFSRVADPAPSPPSPAIEQKPEHKAKPEAEEGEKQQDQKASASETQVVASQTKVPEQ